MNLPVVLADDRAGEPVIGIVVDLEGAIDVTRILEQGDVGAETLLLETAQLRIVVEFVDERADPVAVLMAVGNLAVVEFLAIDEYLRAFRAGEFVVLPDFLDVFGSLTIEENLRMGGVARNDDLGPVLETLYDRFPLLDEKRTAKARNLSGGQRQVLALARALVMEPDVLLIDEPSAGLAPNTADDVFADVQEVNAMDTAILMVEQNATKGLGISDRGYVLDQGTVRFEDQADALLDNEEVSQLYLGG